MPDSGCVLVVGGTAGLGLEVARHYAEGGHDVVITGRDPEHAAKVAAELGGRVRGAGFDLSQPETVAAGLADVGPVRYLVLSAITRDENTAAEYDVTRSLELVTLKL